jgi:hypothetical protein
VGATVPQGLAKVQACTCSNMISMKLKLTTLYRLARLEEILAEMAAVALGAAAPQGVAKVQACTRSNMISMECGQLAGLYQLV